MRTKILALLLILVSVLEVYAVPAKPGKAKFIQPDGTVIELELKGDESVHWHATSDNYTVLKDNSGFWHYAMLDANSDLKMSETKVSPLNSRTLKERSFLSELSPNLKFSSRQIGKRKMIYKSGIQLKSANANKLASNTNLKVLMILVNFSDKTSSYAVTDFDNYMNQVNYKGTGSFKDYFLETSYGALTTNTTVSDWVQVSKTHAYYGAKDGDSNDSHVRELVYEACQLADANGVDFSQFDNDGDGEVEGLAIIHQGQGQEFSGSDENNIWSHSWSLAGLYSSAQRTFDGVKVNSYTIQPEIAAGASNTSQSTIGVMCHEFGHTLGAADFYDTDGDENGDYDGTGRWDLMASGSWNGNGGDRPAHVNMYQKIRFGWVTPIEITNSVVITDMPNAAENAVAYRFYSQTAGEYFILENRQQLKFDSGLPGHGMLIYHVDENYLNEHWNTNDVNTTSHQGLYIKAANGETNNASATWPGTENKSIFNDLSTPNSLSWAGVESNKPLTNIQEENGLISFSISATPPRIIYVDKTASGSNNGESWTNAYTSFQSALGNSNVLDSIFVAKGKYYTTDTSGFVLSSGVNIFGGFEGDETLVSEREIDTIPYVGAPIFKHETILSGDMDYLTNPDNYTNWPSNLGSTLSGNSRRVLDASAVSFNTIIDGFTIEGGNGIRPYSFGGGANLGSGVLLKNSIIRYNETNDSVSDGGGLYVEGATILTSTIHSNRTRNLGSPGGGIYAEGGLIDQSIIHSNKTTGDDSYGGGITMSNGAEIRNSKIANNETTGSVGAGGGVFTYGSTSISNSLIVNNKASYSGGGLYNFGTAINLTVSNNTTTNVGYVKGVYNHAGVLKNSIVWGQAPQIDNSGGTISYSGVVNGILGTGVLDFEATNKGSNASQKYPYFFAPNTIQGLDVNWDKYDYRLTDLSSAIDVGTMVGLPSYYAQDMANSLRISNGAIDMGAYEFKSEDADVTLTVIDKHTGDSIPSCNVLFNGELKFTDAHGRVSFSGLKTMTSYDYNVFNFYYQELSSIRITEEVNDAFTILLQSYPTDTPRSEEDRVMLYPNPSNKTFSIAFTEAADTRISLRVYDLSGQLVQIFSNVQTQEKIWHQLAKGLYVVEIILNDKTLRKELTVM